MRKTVKRTLKTAYISIDTTEPFDAGSLTGVTLQSDEVPTKGDLPHEWREQLNRDRPTYVVYSYGTPIAWVANRNGGKVAVIPLVRYSSSTSRHQNIARSAFIQYTEQPHG